MDDLPASLFTARPPDVDTLAGWWEATAALRAGGATTIDRALVGGACADRLGFAFAAGYAEALHALVPSTGERFAVLCATEEGGAHPRAIRTALTADGDGGGSYRLTGRKRWSTAASEATDLIVIASTGTDAGGRNALRAVRVPAGAPGVRLTPTSAPFVPEIPHAEVALDGVRVAADDLLPGDGYDVYLKPFRTIEDLHVHAALLGYLLGVARRHHLDASFTERALALACCTRDLARADRDAAATHLALAGLLELATALVTDLDAAWSPSAGPEHTRWQRDRPLLSVAASARAARRTRARAQLLSPS